MSTSRHAETARGGSYSLPAKADKTILGPTPREGSRSSRQRGPQRQPGDPVLKRQEAQETAGGDTALWGGAKGFKNDLRRQKEGQMIARAMVEKEPVALQLR